MLEMLERRTLFAVGVPINVLHAYDALTVDATRLNAGVADARRAMARDQRALAADVRALGKSPATAALLRQAQATGARSVAALAGATTRYLAAAKPGYRRLEVAASLFADFPSTTAAKRLAAAQAALGTIQAKHYSPLLTTVTAGGAAYAAALTALAAANPAATRLTADVQAATNNQSLLSTTENAQVTKVQTDVGTLVNVA